MFIVSSLELNVKSTPICESTVSDVLVSVTSWVDSAAPVRVVNWFGRRMRRVDPIFAPSWANESSY